MARKRTRVPLNVFFNARLVGRLQRQASGTIQFVYDQSWLDWEHTFAVSLSLPLREDRYVGDPVVAVFDNLLPDSPIIRRRVAARTRADGIDPYNMLAAIGRDCVGGLQFLPDGSDPGHAGAVEATPVSDADIAKILSDLPSSPLGIGVDSQFRISIAGAQDKTALLLHKGKWCVPHGATATTHILKPQIGHRDGIDLSRSVENEHLCLRILAELGMPVAQTEIRDFDATRALVIERFDREWTSDGRLLRRAQEDFCQALSIPPTRKYQNDGGPGLLDILDLLKSSDAPDGDRVAFLKAQIAFWLLAAIDGHAKNFSVALHPGGGFRLTPLYDVMSAQPLYARKKLQRKDMKLAMSVGNNNHYGIHEIHAHHYYQTGSRARLPKAVVAATLEQTAQELPSAIERACASLASSFPTEVCDVITKGAVARGKKLLRDSAARGAAIS